MIQTKLTSRWNQTGSMVCVGLDSTMERIPKRFLHKEHPQFAFNQWIIEQTHHYALAYKPNLAFYEAAGVGGWESLRLTVEFLRTAYPDIVTIADGKRGDIGSTSEAYAKALFDELGFDAVTLNPYLGREALAPFLNRADKGCIVLCKTSNSGAGEFQDLPVVNPGRVGTRTVWEQVAYQVMNEWNGLGNCMLVVGATYPRELERVRKIVGDMWLLIPGVGVQGGSPSKVAQAGARADGGGLIVNSSRGIVFAEKPAESARQLSNQLRQVEDE